MKQSTKYFPLIVLAGLPLIGLNNALASSDFASSAMIGFTIDNITNESNPGLIPPDLQIGAAFALDSSSSVSLTGNVIFNADNPDAFGEVPTLPGTHYAHTFSLNGAAIDGSIDSFNLGTFSFAVFNFHTTDTFTIDLGFNYLLSAAAHAQNAETDIADTSVYIDYFSDQDFNFGGADYINSSSVFAVPFPVGDQISFSLTLAPGEHVIYEADVGITANLVGSPVPLPAAAWSFLAGLLGLLGIKKRNRSSEQQYA